MVKFEATRVEVQLIAEIVKKARAVAPAAAAMHSTIDLQMSLEACHCNGCPLDLVGLAQARDVDLVHDVFGINRHINQQTGELRDCFVPRYAA